MAANNLATVAEHVTTDKPEAFLGVASSVRGRFWQERLPVEARGLATAISQRHGLSDLMGRILAARGVAIDDCETYLNPTLKSLMPDPGSLRDMEKAAERLADSIAAAEPVAIFGDYDVDGACSVALMARFLAHHNVPSKPYIPDRLFEGYGPNAGAIEQLINDGAKLIVTVDCGTTSHAPLAVAKDHNVDVLIVDHHQADEELPDVHAVVNPNRQDDVSGQGALCAAGVVLLVLVATTRALRRRDYYKNRAEPDLLAMLDLVALATVADVVPLTGLNRAYVQKGLVVMHQRNNIGLTALADAAGLNQPPTPYHLGFILGPRINAGGRIGDSGLGARLLACEDPAEAARIAQTLDRLNRERRELEVQALEEALGAAEKQLLDDPDRTLLLITSDTWHKGIIGLVASRLVERFRRPACVIAWDERTGEGTGSLRSVPGIDLGSAVRAVAAAGKLVKGGGHAMAAGLTVARAAIEEAENFLLEKLAAGMNAQPAVSVFKVDAAITASGATKDVIEQVERAGPFGQGNPQPRFVLPAHRVKFAKVVGGAHVRAVIEAADGSRIDGIAFRAADQPLGEKLMAASGQLPLHLVGHLHRDTWGGRERIELQIEDVADARRK